MDGTAVDIYELSPEDVQPNGQYTVFHPSELELGITVKALLDHVDRTRPVRVVFDSLSEMQLLAGSALRYRRQIRAMKQFFAGRGSTVLLLDDRTAEGSDLQLQSIAHGVIVLHTLDRPDARASPRSAPRGRGGGEQRGRGAGQHVHRALARGPRAGRDGAPRRTERRTARAPGAARRGQ
jgi:circadian clock protein KaiC